MICADREFPEPATQLMLNGAELIIVPNDCDWDVVELSSGLHYLQEDHPDVIGANIKEWLTEITAMNA